MNRGNRIGFKLGLIILTAILVVLLSLGFALDRMFSRFYTAEVRTELQEMAAHFSVMLEAGDITTEQMISSFADFSRVSIYYTNAKGDILFHSGEHQESDRAFIRADDQRIIESGGTVSFEYRDAAGIRYYVIGQPAKLAATPKGMLYVIGSTLHRDESLAAVRGLLLYSGLGAFVLAIGLTWLLARIISRPLLAMQQATRRIAQGELATRLTIGSRDEIGYLAAAINDLALDLQRYRDTRQEFLATVSHELRTPVTYLEGYAKVVRDRLYQTEEERDRYLAYSP